MPIYFAKQAFSGGISWLPDLPDPWTVLKVVVALTTIALLKWYSSGTANTAERQMHGKVVMITGGTSGIGAVTALELAIRGAQIVLLTHQAPSDPFIVEYIEDMREKSGNEMIYAEQVDLASLYKVRQFATKWIDNAPPRRLDMIILCAATLTPPGKPRVLTPEGLEENWMVNYLANFHLLGILSPAIRAQPSDRDVRIIFTTCSSYQYAPPTDDGSMAMKEEYWTASNAYTRSKLALMIFGQAFQKHLDAYKRPDGLPGNTRVIFIDPGYSRTPGFRRWISRGTIWGLALYLAVWQTVWIFLKSAEGGAQSILYAAMEVTLGRGPGGKFIKECREMTYKRADVTDEKVAKKLWEGSEKLIERIEREEAVRRALAKKEQEKANKGGTSYEKKAEPSEPASKTKSRKQKKV
ncbi:hypothetical protein BJ878DRAFT_492916 [Calycina marina]|uniref:NAD(P)-binding protein n=1 Tax=Calycina marina TaxID=1763456 RepID=A0A9P7Z9D5_9HELO|nr:hypothetical protein BJ878DRAFT_492916 [Calycina marina]